MPVEWSIFPNPATEQTWLKSEEKISVSDLSVFDFMGREVVATMEIEQLGEHAILINTSTWSSGVYFLSLNGSTHKLIVQ